MKGFYFIKDVVSRVPYSQLIPCNNDAAAVLGFKEFLDKKEDAKPDYFELWRMCTADEQNQILDGQLKLICFGQDVDETFEKLLQEVKDERL